MSRPLRLEFSGAPYHIASRGYRREDIYEDGRSLVAAYLGGGYALAEIGQHPGLHYPRVSRIVKAAKGKT
jgi:hypothetical protein